MNKNIPLIEAILFLESDPIEVKKIAKITQLNEETIEECLEQLKDICETVDRGVELVKLGEGYLFMPKEDLWDILKEKYGKKNDARLSRAALETLSIIAYNQRITRAEIEKIRGVSADNMIRILTEKELIKAVGRKDVPGRPIQFGTTVKFLKVFKISSISDLPKLNETDSMRFELN